MTAELPSGRVPLPIIACLSRSGSAARTPASTWYLSTVPSCATAITSCRSSGSPATSFVSATTARSRMARPFPANQRCLGSQTVRISSNLITLVYTIPKGSFWARAARNVSLIGPRQSCPAFPPGGRPGIAGRGSRQFLVFRCRELEPVEAMAGQGQQVVEFTDRREPDPAHGLDRGDALEPAQVEFDGLGEPGKVVHAKYPVRAVQPDAAPRGDLRVVFAHEREHARVR